MKYFYAFIIVMSFGGFITAVAVTFGQVFYARPTEAQRAEWADAEREGVAENSVTETAVDSVVDA
jgi:hypothetical protein